MIYKVYILYSPGSDEFYRGQTNNVEARLIRHNNGYELSTKHGIPWILLWYVEKSSRGECIVQVVK